VVTVGGQRVQPLFTDGAGSQSPVITAWLAVPRGRAVQDLVGVAEPGWCPTARRAGWLRHSWGVGPRLPGTSIHGMLRAPETTLA